MYNNDQAHADFERKREADKTDIEEIEGDYEIPQFEGTLEQLENLTIKL